MSTSEALIQTRLSPQLEERLKLHREEVARLREELGNPQEALFVFVRDRFDLDSLAPGTLTRNEHDIEWDDDDDLDAW